MDDLFDNAYWRVCPSQKLSSNNVLFQRIDATRPVDDVHNSVVEEVCALLESMSNASGAKPMIEFSPNDFGI
jgi:hypothetical protein